MHNGPIRDARIVEAVEACRPGSADVADPELAFLTAEMGVDRELEVIYERLQRIDARLAAAFHDVPVPGGLAERLLARLAAAEGTETGSMLVCESAIEAACGAASAAALAEAAQVDGASRAEPVGVALTPRRVSRRWLLAAAVPLAAAASLFAVFVIGLLHPPTVKPYTGSTVMEEAVALFMRELADPKVAEHGPSDARPKEFPLGRDVFDAAEIQWRTVEEFAGQSGVAYDIPGPPRDPQVKATLYVIRYTVDDLPERPRPDLPECRYSTGNCYTLAWQDRDRGLLYVLVYNGREDDHRYYLKPPRPLA
jgi:hypothetical protein